MEKSWRDRVKEFLLVGTSCNLKTVLEGIRTDRSRTSRELGVYISIDYVSQFTRELLKMLVSNAETMK
jgi:hypothetical protein